MSTATAPPPSEVIDADAELVERAEVALERHADRDADAERLAQLEAVVERGLSEFILVGRALAEIRDRRLYLAGWASFAAYLRDRWSFGQQTAYQRIYSAECADAITAAGHTLPSGLVAESLRPLHPLLNQQGAEAVARGWQSVMDRHGDRRRPPSSGDVRRALEDAQLVTSAPPKPSPGRLEPIADRLRTVVRRLEQLRADLGGRLMAAKAREEAAELAGVARRIAAELDALADVKPARKALASLEPEREPLAADLCIGHGSTRDEHGVCRRCRRPDVTRDTGGLRAPTR